MVQISFDTKQSEMLKDILESYLSDLRMEIACTDRMDYRNFLKEQKGFLNNLIKSLTDRT